MRTNIEIDDDLLREAMRVTGQTTKRATVEEALHLAVAVFNRKRAVVDKVGMYPGDCIEQGHELLHCDRDFDPMEQCCGLGVMR